MERRLRAMEVLWSVPAQAVSEASYAIEAALRWPHWDDPTVWAARIRQNHPLDDAGLERAIAAALVRCGAPRGEAARLAELGLEQLLSIAANETEVA